MKHSLRFIDIPPTQGRVFDFDNDVSCILKRRHRPVLDGHLLDTLEDDSAHVEDVINE